MPVAGHLGHPGAGRHRRAHEDEVAALGQRRVRRRRRRILLDRRALAGQRGLVRRQSVRLERRASAATTSPASSTQQVAGTTSRPRRSRRGGRPGRPARAARSSSAAPAARSRRGYSWKKPTSALRTTIVGDGDGVGDLAQRRRDAGRAEQQPDERARELSHEHLRARRRRRAPNLVRPHGLELPPRLVGGQARRRRRRRRRFGGRRHGHRVSGGYRSTADASGRVARVGLIVVGTAGRHFTAGWPRFDALAMGRTPTVQRRPCARPSTGRKGCAEGGRCGARAPRPDREARSVHVALACTAPVEDCRS